LLLAMSLRHPSNLMVLDEPTNDLDLETLDLLQEMIADYKGTVIVVSHDRDFLDRVCTSIIAPDGNGTWIEYAGGYSDMVSQRKGGRALSTGEVAKKKGREKAEMNPLIKTASNKMSFKDKHALEKLPVEISKLENDIKKVNRALAEPGLFEKDEKRFNQLVKLLEKTQGELSAREERWVELEMLREELGG